MTTIPLTITETQPDGTEVAAESTAFVVTTREELEALLNAATEVK